jgi:hypothetical protein
MPKELQENAIGIVNAGEEIGDDSFKKGIEVSRDTIKQGREFFKFNKGLLRTGLTWIVYAVVIVTVILVATGKVNLRLVR